LKDFWHHENGHDDGNNKFKKVLKIKEKNKAESRFLRRPRDSLDPFLLLPTVRCELLPDEVTQHPSFKRGQGAESWE